jgi:hypothetical protein
MAISLNTFGHLAIIFVFVGIFSWNLLDYREGLDGDKNEGKNVDKSEEKPPPEKKLSEEEKDELARKDEAETKKFEKMREDAKKYVADLEDRL